MTTTHSRRWSYPQDEADARRAAQNLSGAFGFAQLLLITEPVRGQQYMKINVGNFEYQLESTRDREDVTLLVVYAHQAVARLEPADNPEVTDWRAVEDQLIAIVARHRITTQSLPGNPPFLEELRELMQWLDNGRFKGAKT